MIRAFLLASAGVVCLAGAGIAGSPASEDPAVVQVNGIKLTLDDLTKGNSNALFQAQNTFYDSERRTVDGLVDQYLLEKRAREEHVTVTELLKIHVDNTIGKDPSEESLRVYYEGLDVAQPYEAVRDKILEHIREKRLARAKADYMKSLRDAAAVSILLSPPRANVPVDEAPVRGPAGAPVVFVEFADYECPYCQQVQPTLDRVEADYRGKVAFVYKDLPLPMHPHAQKAAEAAQCAGLQNKYWEYHDLLFQTKQLEIKDLKSDAKQLGLDTKAFDTCLDSGARAESVKATLSEAQNLGLQATPTFFINGRFYSGNMPYEEFKKAVDEELSRSATTVADKSAGHRDDGAAAHATLQ